MKPLILFDFDGTIADSLEVLVACMNAVAEHHGHSGRATVSLLRTTPTRKVAKALGVRFWQVPGLLKEVLSEFENRLDDVQVHPDVSELLEELSGRAQLGVVSSNDPAIVRSFLKSRGLKKYFPTVEGGSLFGKHRLITRVKKGLGVRHVAYVGDEVRDVLAAKRARVDSLAVSWGLQDAQVLLRARPTMLASSVDEARELLLAWIDSRLI